MAHVRHEPQPFDVLLGVESVGDDVFTTRLEGFEGRSFGGQALGCAALAASRSCEGRALHSLHAWFLRPIPAEMPIELQIERVRDGRRFAHRRVWIRSAEQVLCEIAAGFASPGEGADYQDANVEPATPPPEALPDDEEVARSEGWSEWGPSTLELRWVGTPWRPESRDEPSRYRVWVRPRFPLPDDRGVHAAAMAYLSDFHSHWSVARKLGLSFEPVGFVSLDQVLWLHRDVPWDDWRLLTTESDVGHAGRALTRRRVHTRDGRLVASMAQEALIPAAPAGGGD